jgi:Na+/melibiose symporter-like transporter
MTREGFSTVRKAFYASATLGIGSLDCIIAVFLLKYYTNCTGRAVPVLSHHPGAPRGNAGPAA